MTNQNSPFKSVTLPENVRSRPIQIIFYNNPDLYPPLINGVHLLSQAGFEIDIFCREYGGSWNVQYPSSVRIHRVRGGTSHSVLDYAKFILSVLRLANRRTGVFIGHDMHGFLPARLLATLYRRPLAYHCHDYGDANDAKRIATLGVRLVRSFEQRFARTANLVIVPDAQRAQTLQRELHLRRSPLIVANAPLQRPLFRSARLRETLAAQGSSFERIVFRPGRIGQGHALEATLRSIPFWNSRRWGFVLMGVGDQPYVDHLNNLARSLNVQDQFVILPPVSYDDVASFTVGSDLGHALYEPFNLNHSTATTSSNKVMEYMAAGVPQVVSNRLGLRSLVERYNCGITAEETQPEDIATSINTIFEDIESAHKMGASARDSFENVFCYERQFAPVIRALAKIFRFKRHLLSSNK